MRGLHVLGLAAIVVAAVAVGSADAGIYAPPPGDQQPVWSPDGTAIVLGLFAGRRVSVSFSCSTACEVERWDRHAFLLVPR